MDSVLAMGFPMYSTIGYGVSDVTILIQDNDGTYSVLAIHEIIEKNNSPGR